MESAILSKLGAVGGWGFAVAMLAVAARHICPAFLDYLNKRGDARDKRLAEREARVDASLAKRLDNLERLEASHDRKIQELTDSATAKDGRIALLEQVVTILIGELRAIDPINPRLSEVARMLRGAIPLEIETPKDMLDKLRGLE